jgi:hypothetical protein
MKQLHKQDKILAINVWTNLFFNSFICMVLIKLFNAELITEPVSTRTLLPGGHSQEENRGIEITC